MKSPTKISKLQMLKFSKKISREIELENSNGWKSVNKIHKSKKAYDRKNHEK